LLETRFGSPRSALCSFLFAPPARRRESRTTEEALGINEYLGHANDSASGVKPMTSLFQLQ
jgi:hypothetical protein